MTDVPLKYGHQAPPPDGPGDPGPRVLVMPPPGTEQDPGARRVWARVQEILVANYWNDGAAFDELRFESEAALGKDIRK